MPSSEEKENIIIYALCLILGCIVSGGVILLKMVIALLHNVFFEHRFSLNYNILHHTSTNHYGIFIILLPCFGSLIVTWLTQEVITPSKEHGIREIASAIQDPKGKLKLKETLVNGCASCISLGTGGPTGSESAVIALGSFFGYAMSRIHHTFYQKKGIFITAGVASGIATSFNAPLTGILFALELVACSLTIDIIIPVALATASAAWISQKYFGNSSFLGFTQMNDFKEFSPENLWIYLLFAISMGMISASFIILLRQSKRIFKKIQNCYLRHMIGMCIVGIGLYFYITHMHYYYLEGSGYATIEDVMRFYIHDMSFLGILFISKLLLTTIALGSGASGGTFSPSLFIGATSGTFYALAMNHFFTGLTLDPVTFAIIGMGCIFGSCSGALLTCVIFIYELTYDYYTFYPLFFSAIIAFMTRKFFIKDSLYSIKFT